MERGDDLTIQEAFQNFKDLLDDMFEEGPTKKLLAEETQWLENFVEKRRV